MSNERFAAYTSYNQDTIEFRIMGISSERLGGNCMNGPATELENLQEELLITYRIRKFCTSKNFPYTVSDQ